MLQHEADEDVIEAGGSEWQVEDVGTSEGHVGEARLPHAPLRLRQRFLGDVDGGEGRLRAAAGQDGGLCAHPAARLQHQAAGGIVGIDVQQLGQRGGLVGEPGALAG